MATFTDPVAGGYSGRIAQLALQHFEVESDTIGGRLGVSVSFPDGYDPEGPAIPVVYALDAQWQGGLYEKMHRGLTGPEGLHAVKRFVQVNIGYLDDGIDPLAIRNRDLVPPGEGYPDFMGDYIRENFGPGADGGSQELVDQFFEWLDNPHADHFLAFLEGELHPYIAEHYNVTDGEAGVFGFSYGGLFAIYALTAGSTLFTNFGAGSPGILIPDSTIFGRYRDFAADPANAGRKRHLHMTIGTGEISGAASLMRKMALEDFRFMDLMRSEPVPGVTLTNVIFPGEDHETGCIDAYRSFARTCYAVEGADRA